MRGLLAAALMAAGVLPAAATPRAPLGCTMFIDGFTRAAANRRVVFEKPLNITRGFGGDDGDLDVRVLSTGKDQIEGTLKCKGEAFRRIEVRMEMPAEDWKVAAFQAYEGAALSAALGWDTAKVQAVERAMNADAAEYLRGSIQRGDTSVSGKVEYHQGDALDVGVIWTQGDRTLIITTQDE